MKHIILTTFFTSQLVFAQEDLRIEISKIASIENSVQRLSAYDALAVKFRLSIESKEIEEADSNWIMKIDTSPVDDSQKITAILPADSTIGTGFRQEKPLLVLRLQEGEVTAHVNFNMFLGSDKIESTIRFGKEEAVVQNWGISTSGKGAFTPETPIIFINHLTKVDSFLIRVIPYNESPVTVSFTLKGVDKVNDAILKAATKKKD